MVVTSHGAESQAPRDATSAADSRTRRLSDLALVPVALWLVVLVLAPISSLVVTSFWTSDGGATIREFSLESYARVLGPGVARTLLIRSLLMAIGSAAMATLLAYPLALFVVRRLTRGRTIAILLIVVPLWISYLMRVFAWKIILGERGVLNSVLLALGVVDEPVTAFLYSRFAVFLTLTYVALPYAFITSYTALERVPTSLVEASHDSGAGPWQTFRQVVWPLSRRGAALGFAMALLLAMGDYLTPALVGGLEGTMFGSMIVSEFGLASNWPLGAAMAIVMVGAMTLVLAAVLRSARVEAVLD